MFEYQCGECGVRFERLSWGDSAAELHCDCGSARVERVPYSRVAIGAPRAASDTCAPAMGGCCGGGACGNLN